MGSLRSWAEILGKNRDVPQLTMGGAAWQYDIDCVKIAGTTIIADPNAKEGVLRVLDVGDPGTEGGSVFPLLLGSAFFSNRGNQDEGEGEIRPDGQTEGDGFWVSTRDTLLRRRVVPGHAYEDAVASKIRLASIPIVCTVRGFQLEVNNLSA